MQWSALLRLMGRTLHAFSFLLIVAMALGAVVYSALCAANVASWLTLPLTFGETEVPEAGIYVQLGLTALLLGMMFFTPSSSRVMALEKSHRHFKISMDDVAKAYHACHTADRAGVFTLSSEFDAVRERLAFLRDHPDLGGLETDILTVAAQMGQQSRELADIYSDEKVARAKDFLQQRQKDAETKQSQILEALHICREIQDWADQIDEEERKVDKLLRQLDDQLQAALPALGYSFEQDEAPTNVVALAASKPAE